MDKKPDWTAIKRFYKNHTLAIYEAGRADWGMDPYAWCDADIELTPIEYRIWCDIRNVGVVMYPQYPVAGYFVDFGNPVARVAIECDGRRFHLNKELDRKRQDMIEANGWEVYRIDGKDCMPDNEWVEDRETGRMRFIASPGYTLIKELAERHQIRYEGRRRLSEAA